MSEEREQYISQEERHMSQSQLELEYWQQATAEARKERDELRLKLALMEEEAKTWQVWTISNEEALRNTLAFAKAWKQAAKKWRSANDLKAVKQEDVE
jgi:uncharacterized protein GlcG (DUF336 family)